MECQIRSLAYIPRAEEPCSLNSSGQGKSRPNSNGNGSRRHAPQATRLNGAIAMNGSPRSSDTTLISDIPLATLRRFFAKLEVDPCHGFAGTACILWTGARTSGQGKIIKYGRFKYQRFAWLVHRWAAKHIHGQDIEFRQVDHQCNRPLCVAHLQSISPEWNRELQWIRVQVGIDENPRPQFEPDDFPVPFYPEPEWYRQLRELVA
jgi:hypothetical protein